MRRRPSWAILPLCASFACQDAGRPAPLEDPVPVRPAPDSLLDPEEITDPGRLGACGSETVTLDFIRPNLYFAIDGSGSMTEPIPLGESPAPSLSPPSHRYAALVRAIQSLLLRIGHRVNYGATVFPAGEESCNAGAEIHALGPGDDVSFAVSGEAGPVLRALMFNIQRRAPAGGTPVAIALTDLLPRLGETSAETVVVLVTDGGPNCNPAASCEPEACIPNIERARLTESQVCDESINCCDGNLFGPANCLDTDASVRAVERLRAAGIRTFVIGMPGSEAYGAVLDQLAQAGDTAREESPRYYRVADAEALLDTLSSLGTAVALSCTIELREPPPDPELVNVYFDGEVVPSDPVDGWTFSDSQTVQVHGSACTLLGGGQVLQADVVSGCPIVIR